MARSTKQLTIGHCQRLAFMFFNSLLGSDTRRSTTTIARVALLLRLHCGGGLVATRCFLASSKGLGAHSTLNKDFASCSSTCSSLSEPELTALLEYESIAITPLVPLSVLGLPGMLSAYIQTACATLYNFQYSCITVQLFPHYA